MTTETTVEKTPVLVTRGWKTPSLPQTERILSQRIDWIEGTFKGRTPVNLPSILSQKHVPCKAYNGYTLGSLYDDGRTLFQNPLRPEMGAHLTWSGDACGQCPMDVRELVQHLWEARFSFTRIDVAIDLINCSIHPADATEEIKHGRCKTRARQFPYWADATNKGYTQYIGKKASEIYCRIYDKAAEMGIEQDHTRVELVVRRDRATLAAREIVRDGDYRRLVAAYLEFPEWDTWNSAMAVRPTKLPSEAKESRTKQWLLSQVAASLARQFILDGDRKFEATFMAAVNAFYEHMSNNVQTVH